MKRVWQNGRVVEIRDSKEPKLEISDEKEPNFQGNSGRQKSIQQLQAEVKYEEEQYRISKFKEIPECEEYFEWSDGEGTSSQYLNQEIKSEPLPPKITLEERKMQRDRQEAKIRKNWPVVEEEKPEKFEEIEELKAPKIEEETVEKLTNPTLDIPKWQPKIKSVTDFLLEDSPDTDCNMTLGTSVLFDMPRGQMFQRPRAGSSFIDYDSHGFPFAPVDDDLLRNIIKNPHPRAMQMQRLSEHFRVPYREIFQIFEEQRKKRGYVCKEGDACHRIRRFIARENEPISDSSKVSDGIKQILHHELEVICATPRPISIGYIHAIMEKTDLPPAYIREAYIDRRKRASLRSLTQDPNRNDSTNLPPRVLRQLEDAYLQKKYKSTSKEWSPQEIKEIGDKLRLHSKTVLQWITKRESVYDSLEQRKIPQALVPYTGLKEPQVKDYFAKKRNQMDLRETREATLTEKQK